MIKDVTWNFDSASGDIVFVHVKDEQDNKLTIEIERRRGGPPWKWIVSKRSDFRVRVL